MMKRSAILLVLMLLVLPAFAQAVSFEIDTYAMDIAVQPDGSALFTEVVNYTFDGEHNGFLATIRHDDVLRLRDLALFVEGGIALERVEALDGVPYTYTAISDGEATAIQAYAPGTGGPRSLTLQYSLSGYAQRYQDTARANHMLLYSENDYGEATFTVSLPEAGTEDILAFVHGGIPADLLTVDGNTVRIGPTPLESGDKVELDLLFPQAWLPDARVIQSDMREAALAQEAEIAATLAETSARQAQLARVLLIAVLIALVVYAIAYLVLFLRMRKKYGLRGHIIPVADDSLLADLPVAQAQYLKEGSVSASGLSAALLALVDAGVLSLHIEEGRSVFTLLKRPQTLAPHEAFLLDWLFANGAALDPALLDAGEDYESANHFTTQYNLWKTKVAQDTRDRGWLFANNGTRLTALLSALFAGLAISFFLLRAGLWPLAVPGIVLSLLYTLLFSRIRKYTDAGEKRLAAIDGFLANYEDRLQAAPESIIGKAPLVMALGYLEPMADWIDSHPQAQAWTGYDPAPYWVYAGWHRSLLRVEQDIREAQSHNAGIQSAGSGSGSSGGGFSGGSGGSSHGAW